METTLRQCTMLGSGVSCSLFLLFARLVLLFHILFLMSTDLYFYPLVLSTCMRSVSFSKISRIVQRHKIDIRRSDACLFATTTTKEQRSSHPTSTQIKLHITSDLMTHLTFLPTLNVRHPLDVCGSCLTLSSRNHTTRIKSISTNQSSQTVTQQHL
jgi:hypothetical protein